MVIRMESEDIDEDPRIKSLNCVIDPDSTRISQSTRNVISVIYFTIGFLGVVGNLLVVAGVLFRKALRTERNLLILNLSISDLWQCVLTMPMTLNEIKSYWWNYGHSTWLCRVFTSITSVSVFVSTLSITAIAVDRYWVICNPHSESFTFKQGLFILPSLWLISLAMVLPIVLSKKVQVINTVVNSASEYFDINTLRGMNFNYSTNASYVEPDVLDFCSQLENSSHPISCSIRQINSTIEECCEIKAMYSYSLGWDDSEILSCNEDISPQFRLLYSVLSLLFQYLLPGIALSIANAKIYRTLHYKELGIVQRKDAQRRKEEISRLHKTKNLLVMIGTIFLVFWLPLNIFNLTSDTIALLSSQIGGVPTMTTLLGIENTMILYAATHTTAMLCTVINPILYGFFNENFNKEFKQAFQQVAEFGRKCSKGPVASSV